MDADVLVLGAGLAGLRAARALADAGARVIVLEARDRIGGRIRTDRTLGVPVELGPSWLGGASRNPLVDVVEDAGLGTRDWDWNDSWLRLANGRVMERDETRALAKRFKKVARELKKAKRGAGPQADQERALDAALHAIGSEGDEREALRWWSAMQLGMFQGADLDDLSLRAYGEESGMPGDDRIVLGGIDAILPRLAQGLDVRLEHVARRVEPSPQGVAVETDRRTFRARALVCALPLPVLRVGITFSPALPAEKRLAIDRIGVSLLDRVALRFDARFWTRDTLRFGRTEERRAEWVDLTSAVGAPVLTWLTKTEYARELEAMDDARVVEEALADLRATLGTEVPAPRAAAVTRWSSDPYALGSYVHVAPGGSGDDLDALAKPVDGALFFAGDATDRDSPGTLEAAWNSGARAAREALAQLRSEKVLR